VERTHEPALTRAAVFDQLHAAVTACVLERPYRPVPIAQDNDGLVEELVFDEVERFRNLFQATRHLPHARPEALAFERVEIGVVVPLLGDAVIYFDFERNHAG